VQHLLKSGALVRLSPDVVVHAEVLAGLEAKVAGAKGRTMSVGDFRDLLGLTRKNLIPLLEHLDRRRLTRRVGDARVVE
jgi:selenocysteine-specific elongation factor